MAFVRVVPRFAATVVVVAAFAAAPAAVFSGGEGYRKADAWLVLVPGGGQFLLGQTAWGVTSLAATTGLAGLGVWAEGRRRPGEVNAPLVWAQQVYAVSLYSAYRDFSIRLPSSREDIDPSSMATLAAAPFRADNLLNPWVIGFAALGVAVNAAAVEWGRGRARPSRIRGVEYLGGDFGRAGGIGTLSASWLVLSYGAGTSEEMLFRGMLQPSWERRWGPTGGLLAASALFGLAHVADPADDEAWLNAGFAALAGVYLGWRFQRTGNRLSEPISAHFWFDVAAGVTAFLLDPADNALGAKVRFSY